MKKREAEYIILMKYGLSDTVIADTCGMFMKHTNIDKILILGDNISFNQLMDINNQIEVLGLLYKVDVVDYNKNTGTPIGEHIARVGLPFLL